MANWTPQGFIGRLFKLIGAHVPPPAGVKSPALWGTEAHLNELFGAQAAQIHCEKKTFAMRFIARRRTGCRCSATSTARRTRLSPRSTPTVSARWSERSRRSWTN